MKFEMETLQAARQAASVCAERLRLPLRSKVWKGAAGEFAGSGTGSSLDFQDHRNYVPGDDPRHINWQAYARTGQYTMKLYREEVRPVIDIFFDCSASMFVTKEKKQRSLELFYFLTESAGQSGASLQIHLLNGGQHQLVSRESVTTHLWANDLITPDDPAAPPTLHNIPLRTNAIRVPPLRPPLPRRPQRNPPHPLPTTRQHHPPRPLHPGRGQSRLAGQLRIHRRRTANPPPPPHRTRRPQKIPRRLLPPLFPLENLLPTPQHPPRPRPAEPDLLDSLHQDALKVGALESLH